MSTIISKRGRPKKSEDAARTVRISPRFSPELAARIQRAADWRGVPVAVFVAEAAAERAEQVMDKEEKWVLSEQAAAVVADMIAHPPAPTAYARRAAKLAQDVIIRS
jgi:uncharacterized protein (DUF1778 family)